MYYSNECVKKATAKLAPEAKTDIRGLLQLDLTEENLASCISCNFDLLELMFEFSEYRDMVMKEAHNQNFNQPKIASINTNFNRLNEILLTCERVHKESAKRIRQSKQN